MADENPLAEQSDARLVSNALASGATQGAFGVEMMRRLKDSLDAGTASAAALTKRLERLNLWLLWVTVLIGALTLVQLLVAVKVIGR